MHWNSYQYELITCEFNFVVSRSTLDQSCHARIAALITNIQMLHDEIDLLFEEINRQIEVSSREKIDLMRLTATSQGSAVNDCNVAEKLSHSSALGWGVGIKVKDLNGITSSGQGCCNKDYMSDEDLEEHLRKMKAKSTEMLKKLSEKRYQLLQTYGKSLIPTVQASNAQPCSMYNLKLIEYLY
ncbi:uncharacterized protein LOC114260283 isoform X1 [Camellia sinensis]|uniref:uncharacterized protein LOC114260283 isoform X1 n=2 Tax=Camellia sinensis TaxID=4442 RepID=UPI001036B0D2|nr:uncharacterized protein LOC114260283 isoform X1 [Camellia sinensis]